jgi:hypothetical protein
LIERTICKLWTDEAEGPPHSKYAEAGGIGGSAHNR